MTNKEKELQGYIDKWKKLLRLQDWNIRVLLLKDKKYIKYLRKNYKNVPESDKDILELDSITDCGSVLDIEAQPYIYNRTAEIVVLDTKSNEKILERLIVHELLHIMFVYIVTYKSDLEIAKVEQVVRTLEELLMNKEK